MSRTASRRRGFTLLELIVVLAVIGIVMGAGVVAMGGRLPAYALRRAAREFGGNAEVAWAIAATRREALHVYLQLDEEWYSTGHGPKPANPEAPDEERKEALPKGMVIRKVRLADNQTKESSWVNFEITREGLANNFVVEFGMEDDPKQKVWVRFNGMVGQVSYVAPPDDEPEFIEYR